MAVTVSTPSSKITRRHFAKAALAGVAGLALYSGEVERHFLEVSRSEVPITGLHADFDGMRIVQLSDIHMDAFTEPFFLHDAVDRINGLNPDAVFLTGDFVTGLRGLRRFGHGAAWQCANILNRLKCTARYAILGNHDVSVGEAVVSDALTHNSIKVLRNAFVPIERGAGRFWLAGLDDPLEGNPDPDLAIPASIRNLAKEPVVLLCHGPDYVDDLLTYPAGGSVALMLSGHTHGGQIRLPFYGPLELPVLGRKYVEGWFRFGKLRLHVNRGLGTVGVPFRFDCPPEISVFTLRAV